MRILVAPMDWGLGHASRCLPLIRELIDQGAEVILASAGSSQSLLQKTFPALPAENLPAYAIRYPSRNMLWNMALQSPRLAQVVWAERKRVGELAKRYVLDAIISDNRFGCYSQQTYNVFITHQLAIRTPKLWNLFPPTGFINKVNRRFIHAFDECWIPDIPGPNKLSGELSAASLNIPIHHIGWTSEMKRLDLPTRYACAAILSGPEPQRTYLEKILREQLMALQRPCVLIQGKIGEQNRRETQGELTIIPYLLGKSLNETLAAGDLIIARSGYSTLMDLAVLRKKALLIPTPGQTEQIYLAERLQAKGYACYQDQNQVNVKAALEKLGEIRPFDRSIERKLLTERVEKLLERLS